MNRPHSLLASLAVVFALLAGGGAVAQTCLLADFDEDGSPWTIRSGCPGSSCTLNFILEVPPDPPLDRWFWIIIDEGCCDVFEQGHYGARLELDLDFTYVDFQEKHYPTCICCAAWLIQGHFRPDAPFVPGERYVIGTGRIDAVCTEPDPPCFPTHDYHATFTLETGDECGENTVYGGGLACGPAGAPEAGADAADVPRLGPICPSPVRGGFRASIELPFAAHVAVGVYDLSGREIARILDSDLTEGTRAIAYDLSREGGARLSNGIYFLRLQTTGTRHARMFIVAR